MIDNHNTTNNNLGNQATILWHDYEHPPHLKG
jgi:hypothetical protein